MQLDKNHVQDNAAATPNLHEQLKDLKIHVEQEIQTFANVVKQTRAENIKWIGAAKKQQNMPTTTVEVMNATIQEEAKRKVRALHVRVIGWQEKGNPMEDTCSLTTRMRFSELLAARMESWHALHSTYP